MTKNLINTQDPVELASGGTTTSSLSPQYGVLYATTTSLATTGAGSAGQVLTSAGSGSAPSFQASTGGSGGGGWVLLQTQTVSGASAITFISQINSTYSTYVLTYCRVTSSVSGGAVQITLSYDNGASWVSSGYTAALFYLASTATSIGAATTSTYFYMGQATDTNYSNFGVGWLYNLGVSAFPVIEATCLNYYTSTGYWSRSTGHLPTLGAYNAIKISSGGTITLNGTFSLYGVQK